MGRGTNKVFLPLGDMPILGHTLSVFEACPLITEVVVAVGDGEEDTCRREVIEPLGLHKVTGLVRGGASRQESVRLALRFIGTSADVVVVHDGARPLLPLPLLTGTASAGYRCGAVAAGLPAKDTVKRVGTDSRDRVEPPDSHGSEGPSWRILETLERSGLWQVQTPQVFWRDLLAMAHERAANSGFRATDDATLVERLRHPVLVIPGSEENIKITTPLDLVLARAILEHRVKRRAG